MDPDAADKLESSENERLPPAPHGSSSQRGRHWLGQLPVDSWAWYLWPMTSLGLSTLLHAQEAIHDFPGLYALGVLVYMVGVIEYFLTIILKTNKALLNRRTLIKSISKPSEAMFFATFWISTFGLITAGIQYSDPAPGGNLATTFFAIFWIWIIFALCASVGMFIMLAHINALESKDMTPAWLLPLFPLILTGVMTGSLAECLGEAQAFPVLITGLIYSGVGFLLSLPVDGIYLWRLYCAGLPGPDKRPAMMLAVGPPSYAPLAFLKMAAVVPTHYAVFAEIPIAGVVCQVMALVFGVAIVGMALFLFLMAFFCILRRANQMSFHLTWYGFIFPNVGLVSLVGVLGAEIPSDGVQWVVSVFTALIVGAWLFVFGMHMRALVMKKDAF
ncbi:uncharacterized protein LTR77_007156 [Saxophila tyrrhenica]|uniref:C4-dicarboxylate transporter/malic acid transport protein n=1 Tax=Saxophila tyrrhenica TaxID=1690608 RepID=A0AAV9P4D6_9PEZI|nr:hypothetical protein LTR77_007156 [Saxophila tyrrhenica]